MSRRDAIDAQYRAMDGDEAAALDHGWYRHLLPYATSRVDVACAMLGQRRFERACELGVGTGELARRILGQVGSYVGYDLSPYQLSRVPEEVRADARVRLVEHDLEQPIPAPDAAYDLVISLSTIEYLRDPVAFVREIRRVVQPGGTLLLHTMNLAFLPRRLQLLLGRLPTFNAAAGWQGGVLHNFTHETLRRLLEGEGFLVERVACAGLLPALRRVWLGGLASDLCLLCRRR